MSKRLTRKIFITAVMTIAALATVQSANAITIFFGEDTNANNSFVQGGNAETARNNFLSNLTGVGTEDFESFSAGQSGNGLNLSFPGSAGGITAALTGSAGTIADTSPSAGRFATSGTNYLNGVRDSFTLTFNTPIAAFGFYGTDIGDFNGQITIDLDGGAQFFNVGNTIGVNGGLLFWGFVGGAGETFNTIVFDNTSPNGSDAFGFDDMTIGDAGQVVPPTSIPEPGSLALLTLGLGLLGIRRRIAISV